MPFFFRIHKQASIQSLCHYKFIAKQGRILLPPVLREYADLQKDVVLVGVLSRVEIWDKGRWLENTYDEDEMDDIAEHMAELGFSI